MKKLYENITCLLLGCRLSLPKISLCVNCYSSAVYIQEINRYFSYSINQFSELNLFNICELIKVIKERRNKWKFRRMI